MIKILVFVWRGSAKLQKQKNVKENMILAGVGKEKRTIGDTILNST